MTCVFPSLKAVVTRPFVIALLFIFLIPLNALPADAAIYDFNAAVDGDNSLRVIATWKTESPASSKVEYRASSGGVWLATPVDSEALTDHEVVVVGLKKATSYEFRPVSDGIAGASMTVSTGDLPGNFPGTFLRVPGSGSSVELTLGGFPFPISAVIAVNNGGDIVWYHVDSEGGDPGDFYLMDDGRLAYNTYSAIKAVDYRGNEEVLLDASVYGEVVHHDFLVTPEGNYMYMTRSRVFGNDRDWCTDDIVERDSEGNEVWRWKSADHAGELGYFFAHNRWQELFIEECGADWTHANSIHLYTDEGGNRSIILSIRNMNRVIKIDYGSGEVVWQLGGGLDFAYTGAEAADLQWFLYQHSASYLPDGSVLLFDNGNDRYEETSQDFSRVLIYKLDETQKTSEISWEYDLLQFVDHAGNVRMLENGNILLTIPNDQNHTSSSIQEVDPSGTKVWESLFYYPSILPSNFMLGNIRVGSLYALTAPAGAQISVSPASHDFGSLDVGATSEAAEFSLSNTAASYLNVSAMGLSDTANYVMDEKGGANPCGTTAPRLAAGEGCTVTVTFNPLSEGAFDATLTVSSDDPDNPEVGISLAGSTHGYSGVGGGGVEGGGGGGCFIATAAYGSYLHPHVATLRDFRDSVLLNDPLGRVFVGLYYRFSPPLADLISRHEALRMVARWGLTPVVYGVRYPGLFLLIVASGAVMAVFLSKRLRGSFR